jgi:hypothetical protein
MIPGPKNRGAETASDRVTRMVIHHHGPGGGEVSGPGAMPLIRSKPAGKATQ